MPFLFGCFRIGPLIGLFLMAIACGNIKPCLAAFGGDQFRSDQVTITGFPVYFQPNQRIFFSCIGASSRFVLCHVLRISQRWSSALHVFYTNCPK